MLILIPSFFLQKHILNIYENFFRSHCACDDEFAKCLKQAGKPAADFMGNIYFNILQVSCIQDQKQGKQFRTAKKY